MKALVSSNGSQIFKNSLTFSKNIERKIDNLKRKQKTQNSDNEVTFPLKTNTQKGQRRGCPRKQNTQ